MNRDEIRMKLWCDVFSKSLDSKLLYGSAVDCANAALESFDKGSPAESSEPAEEPKRVWMTFGDYGFDGDSFDTEEAAAADMREHPDIVTAYAEFQQVGPMVRRDDSQTAQDSDDG